MPFIPNSEADRAAMLATIGKPSIEALFADIPAAKRFPSLKLPMGIAEMDALAEIEALSARNLTAKDGAWFLGAGAYNHFIPSLVPALASRGEFLTAYTPYQPEVSQGTLQSIFEYQSMAAVLLGVAVVNASHYDVATALAEAILMACKLDEGRRKVLLPRDLNPEYEGVVTTYLSARDIVMERYEGAPDTAGVDASTSCLVAGYPTFSGEIHGLTAAAKAAHKAGALLVVQADPLMCAILNSPGIQGADIVVAEGQCLGNSMNFGGPFLGMMGATEKLMRKMPGRIVGEAFDHQGRKGYVLTLTAREQHIRREKAVSNICSNQGLTMLQTCIYLAAMGSGGLKTVAKLCWDKAHYAAGCIAKLPGYSIQPKTFFKEFLVSTPLSAEVLFDRLRKKHIVPGLPLSRYFPDRPCELLVCVTEMNRKTEVDALARALEEASL
ncbi:MAG: aminomethyl-transferring glycine dehydrogenase subunit GcvPA [Spirochaetes bacterium]|nr:aminomethyl-transferring glycine dehydrogenase subunit GcvPA [Spirochaetota bacterium]